MRQAFIPAETREQAKSMAPWACKIVKVYGGYQAFESIDDYNTWRKQR